MRSMHREKLMDEKVGCPEPSARENEQAYKKRVKSTELSDYSKPLARMNTHVMRMLHAAMGISTEAGELHDQFKRHIYYGTDLDVANIVEELGDLLFYMTMLTDELHITMDDVRDANSKKLYLRYAGKFSEGKATERDLKAEYEALQDALGFTEKERTDK
jgi:NTP pyrophosphatase (non-canonical NTP hydrolase)